MSYRKNNLIKKSIVLILAVIILMTFSACEGTPSLLDPYYISPPNSISIVDGVLMWNSVSKSDSYLVNINGEKSVVVNGLSLSDFLPNEEYTVKIASRNFWFTSEFSEEFTFVILETPKDFVYFNENFYWTFTGDSDGFVLNIDGKEIETPYLTKYNYIFSHSGESVVRVKSKGDGVKTFDSAYSLPISVSIPSKSWGSIRAIQPTGNGSASFPYNMTSLENFKWLDNQNTFNSKAFEEKNFVLANDIDFKYIEGFNPIGGYDSHFYGSFDGKSNAIVNLSVSNDYAGLFGILGVNASVRNLVREGGLTNGSFVSGGIVASNYGTVFNCVNSSEVKGRTSGGIVGENADGSAVLYGKNSGYISGNTSGGIVGQNWNGVISNSFNFGDIDGINVAGGLVGTNNGSLDRSKSSGDVSAYNAGGVVGNNVKKIVYCMNTGKVTGRKVAGGLVSVNSGTIDSSYNLGDVIGNPISSELYIGGLVGRINQGEVTSSYSVCDVGTINAAKRIYLGSLVGYYRSGLIQDVFYMEKDYSVFGNTDSVIGSATLIKSDISAEEFANLLNGVKTGSVGQKIWKVAGQRFPILFWE